MAKNTARDSVWTHAIEMRDNIADPHNKAEYSYLGDIRVPEVIDRIEENEGEGEAPSERTVSDTLESMAEAGILNRVYSGGSGRWGRYSAPDHMTDEAPDSCEVCAERFVDSRRDDRATDAVEIREWHGSKRPKEDSTLFLCSECAEIYPDDDALSEREDENHWSTA